MSKKAEKLSPELEARVIAAIRKGEVEPFEKLLEEGFDVNAPLAAEKGKTPLALAAERAGSRDVAELLLKAGAEWKNTGIDLIWATYFDSEWAVGHLLKQGANPSYHPARSLGSPLNIAARRNHVGMVRMLIDAGADVNDGVISGPVKENHTECALMVLKAGARVPKGEGLLAAAIQKGNTEVALALIAAGADLAERSDVRGWNTDETEHLKLFGHATPLIVAAGLGNAAVVTALVKAGADVHVADAEGKTALERARQKKHGKVVALLEEAVAKQPRTVDPGVDLLFAAEKGEAGKVRELVAAGANVETRDTRPKVKGFTALMLAARGGHAETVAALLEAGGDKSAKDDNDPSSDGGFSFVLNESGASGALESGFQMHRNALHWGAASNGGTVRVLIEHGADVNGMDRAKMTPLMIAAEAGRADAVKELLAGGADPKVKGRKKQDALFLAAEEGHAEVVRILLAAGVDANQKDGGGDTPLMAAARRGHVEAIAALLEAGADATAANRDGETALHQITGSRHYERRYIKGSGLQLVLRRPAEDLFRAAELLIAAGADPNSKTKHDSSPLGQAAKAVKELPFYQRIVDLFGKAQPRGAAPVKIAVAPKAPKPKAAKVVRESAEAPDFAKAAAGKSFQAALAELEALTGAKCHPLNDVPGGFSFHLHSSKTETFDLAAVQKKLLAKGCFVFSTDPETNATVAAIPTTNRYDALLAMQTNGINCDVLPQDIIAWLEKVEAENPFVLTGVGHDFVRAKFMGKVKKAGQLAKAIAKLCPDADEGTEGVAEDLKASRRLFLWWD